MLGALEAGSSPARNECAVAVVIIVIGCARSPETIWCTCVIDSGGAPAFATNNLTRYRFTCKCKHYYFEADPV